MSTVEVKLPTDAQMPILFSGEPGAGKILQQIREQRGWTQDHLASKLNLTRSAIAYWETERKWPRGKNLEKLLAAVAPDSTMIRDQRIIGRVTTQELGALVHQMKAEGKGNVDIGFAVYEDAYPRVITTLALAAQGAPGIALNPQCTRLFIEHWQWLQEETRKRALGQAVNVTAKQQQYVDRDVYESTPKDSPQVVDNPTDTT